MGELVTTNANSMIPLDQAPDYLKGNERTGLETLGQGDYKIPRILMLQALNPECRAFPGKAIPGNFWHNGANISLGTKFNMVAGIAAKKVILFKPRWEGGGVLAISNDSQKWDNGGNKSFIVKPVDKSEKTVVWNTGRDVASSGLARWGSSNPEVENSPPAATQIYEYLVYLPDHPNLSPCLLSMSKTALPEGRALNTSYMMLKKPMAAVVMEISAKERQEGNNVWYVPVGRSVGWAPREIFETVSRMGEQYANYQADYTEDTVAPSSGVDAPKGDEIPF